MEKNADLFEVVDETGLPFLDSADTKAMAKIAGDMKLGRRSDDNGIVALMDFEEELSKENVGI